MTTIVTGRLRFLGWLNGPWTLERPDGSTVDLLPLLKPVLLALHNKPASHHRDRTSYELKSDPASEFNLVYDTATHGNEANPVLMKPVGFGFSNAGLYLIETLQWINGRQIKAEIADDRFRIEADPTEQVHVVQFFGRGNSARIKDGDEARICKVATTEACVFLGAGPGGFECLKFAGSTTSYLLDRIAKDSIRARRIGECEINGREPETTEAA